MFKKKHSPATKDYRHLIGKDGITITSLTPQGLARFGKEEVPVIGNRFFEEGEFVKIVRAEGNIVFVSDIEKGKSE